MSWQRILETARRHGLPIVVTDPAGREPMVVLPLEVYEALTEESPSSIPAPEKDVEAPIRVEAVDNSDSFPPSRVVKKALSDLPADLLKEMAPLPKSAQVGSEMTLEDRFYLEPVDEEENQPR